MSDIAHNHTNPAKTRSSKGKTFSKSSKAQPENNNNECRTEEKSTLRSKQDKDAPKSSTFRRENPFLAKLSGQLVALRPVFDPNAITQGKGSTASPTAKKRKHSHPGAGMIVVAPSPGSPGEFKGDITSQDVHNLRAYELCRVILIVVGTLLTSMDLFILVRSITLRANNELWTSLLIAQSSLSKYSLHRFPTRCSLFSVPVAEASYFTPITVVHALNLIVLLLVWLHLIMEWLPPLIMYSFIFMTVTVYSLTLTLDQCIISFMSITYGVAIAAFAYFGIQVNVRNLYRIQYIY